MPARGFVVATSIDHDAINACEISHMKLKY